MNNILFDSIERLLSDVLSSVIVDEERIVFDNDGDIYSDNDCNIQLGRRLLTDECPLFKLYNEDDDDDDDDDDKEIISELKSNIGVSFLSSFVERIH